MRIAPALLVATLDVPLLTVVASGPPSAAALPRLPVSVVIGGLDHPWDVAPITKGRLLVTERGRARLSVVRRGHRRTIPLVGARIWTGGETGLMGLEVDPRWRTNHRIYTCQ